MIKCSRCGVEFDDSFKQCPNCGNDLFETIDEKPVVITPNDNVCSHCGLKITDDSDFCLNCGNKLNDIQTMACSECGSQVGENDLICPVCGAKIESHKICSNCGASVDDDAEFCEECGKSLNLSKKDANPAIEENLQIVARGTLSVFDRIILFFKQLFGGNS